MHDSAGREQPLSAGYGLIAAGLSISIAGAASVALLIIGLSLLYVDRAATGIAALIASAVLGVLFAKTYGPYLDRLERRAPMRRYPAGSLPGEEESDEREDEGTLDPGDVPLPPSAIIWRACAAFGALIGVGGLIWTDGMELVLNLIACLGLLISAFLVGWLGRPQEPR